MWFIELALHTYFKMLKDFFYYSNFYSTAVSKYKIWYDWKDWSQNVMKSSVETYEIVKKSSL